jgi:hypothetical protein
MGATRAEEEGESRAARRNMSSAVHALVLASTYYGMHAAAATTTC